MSDSVRACVWLAALTMLFFVGYLVDRPRSRLRPWMTLAGALGAGLVAFAYTAPHEASLEDPRAAGHVRDALSRYRREISDPYARCLHAGMVAEEYGRENDDGHRKAWLVQQSADCMDARRVDAFTPK